MTALLRLPELAKYEPDTIWSSADARNPTQVLWVPLLQRDHVIGALSAQRYEDDPFTADEVRLLESAAPVVGIALRTVRLNRANQLALTHSVRIQEVAALAGNDLGSVVASVNDIETMLPSTNRCTCPSLWTRCVEMNGTTLAPVRRSATGTRAGTPWNTSP